MYTRLRDIHPSAGTLTFPRNTDIMHNFTLHDTRGRLIHNTNHEAHEQFVVHRFLRPTDSVIELGGGIGTNSIQINMTLKGRAKSQHYVFEPQAELVKLLRENGRLNGCKFHAIHGVLSKERGVRVPSFNADSKTWIFVKADTTARGPIVPSIKTLPVHPTAIVADCEGCLLKVLTDFPEILRNIRMVYMENDGGREVLQGVREILLSHGLEQKVNTSHHKLFVRPGRRRSRRRSKSFSR
jgi:FkbM family methyltransferase